MTVFLAPDVKDVYLDEDGTAAVMVGAAVLALSPVSSAIVQVLTTDREAGAELSQLWTEVRRPLVDAPDDEQGPALLRAVLDQLASIGLVSLLPDR